MFAEQLRARKLYLSWQDVTGMRRFFSARMENPRTKKNDFLCQAMNECVALLELHSKVSVTMEDPWRKKSLLNNLSNWGLEGKSGKGLALLSELNPQHNTWLKLR